MEFTTSIFKDLDFSKIEVKNRGRKSGIERALSLDLQSSCFEWWTFALGHILESACLLLY